MNRATPSNSEKEPDSLLKELLDPQALPIHNSWSEVFDWWPGHPPSYPYDPDVVLCFDPQCQGWVPPWFPRHHWKEVSNGGQQLRPLAESERAAWFHLWLRFELETDDEWRHGTSRQRAIRVGYAVRAMLQWILESRPEDWWHPPL